MHAHAHDNRNDLTILDEIMDRNTYLPHLAFRQA